MEERSAISAAGAAVTVSADGTVNSRETLAECATHYQLQLREALFDVIREADSK
jgi:hypothetical protein